MNILLSELASTLLPLVLSGIGAVLTLVISRAASAVEKRWDIEIEERHRNTLHSALITGISAALLRGAKRDTAIQAGIDHALVSVPDAIAELAPKPEVLRNLAESKLRQIVEKALPA